MIDGARNMAAVELVRLAYIDDHAAALLMRPNQLVMRDGRHADRSRQPVEQSC